MLDAGIHGQAEQQVAMWSLIVPMLLSAAVGCTRHGRSVGDEGGLCWHVPPTSETLAAYQKEARVAVPFAFSPDGKRVLLCSPGDGARIVDVESGQVVVSIGLHLPPYKRYGVQLLALGEPTPFDDAQPVDDAVWANDDVLIFVSGTLVVGWSLSGRKELYRLDVRRLEGAGDPTSYWTVMAVSSSGPLALGFGNSIYLHDAISGRSLGGALHREGNLGRLAFSPDGAQLLATGMFPGLLIFDIKARKQEPRKACVDNEAHAAAFSLDGKTIWVSIGDWGAAIVRMDVESGKHAKSYSPLIGGFAFAYDPQSSLMVVGDGNGTVTIIDVDTMQESSRLVEYSSAVRDVRVAPGGQHIGVAYCNGGVSVFASE